MKCILLAALCVSLGSSQTISLRKTAYLPRGAQSWQTFVKVIDANHNGKNDVVFRGGWTEGISGMSRVFFYENSSYDTYMLRESIGVCTDPSFYDIGYLDNDSLTDAVVQCNLGGVYSYAVVFESPSYFSYPTQIVWQWRYEVSGGSVAPSFIGDFDRDGKMDFLTSDCGVIYVFENAGDNQYQKVYWDTLKPEDAYHDAVGDYDQDGATEIVMGTPNGYVYVYECTGDNRYAKVFTDTLPQPNLMDLWSGNDLDNDGKPEFFIGSFRWPYGYHLFVFEATGNNSYEYIEVDSIVFKPPHKDKMEGHSSCGDIDGDGKDEIVWAIADRFSVYNSTGNNQYQMIYRSPRKRYTSTHAIAYDVNKNGYAEIIESAVIDSPYVRTETTIWEIEGVRLHRPNGGEVITPGSQFPITWEKFSPPGADSFALFVSFDNGLHYSNIASLQNSNDTLFLWSVPDSLSDSCRIMIWAYGPPRAGENKPRGTAWDFSDSVFAVRQTAVGDKAMGNRQWAGLKILQNPTTREQGVRLQVIDDRQEAELKIYDVAGKLVRSLMFCPSPIASRPITLHLSPGIYFVRLEAGSATITKKTVVLE